MNTLEYLDRNSLWLQLENCRAFLQLNPHFLEEDRLLIEQVLYRMGMLQSSLHEVDMWEKLKTASNMIVH